MCLHVWVRFKLHFYKKNFRGILTWIVSVVGGGRRPLDHSPSVFTLRRKMLQTMKEIIERVPPSPKPLWVKRRFLSLHHLLQP